MELRLRCVSVATQPLVEGAVEWIKINLNH